MDEVDKIHLLFRVSKGVDPALVKTDPEAFSKLSFGKCSG